MSIPDERAAPAPGMDKPAFDAEAREIVDIIVPGVHKGKARVLIAAAFQRIHDARQLEIDGAYDAGRLAEIESRPPPPPAPAERERLATALEHAVSTACDRFRTRESLEALVVATRNALRAIPASGVEGWQLVCSAMTAVKYEPDDSGNGVLLFLPTTEDADRLLELLAAAPPPGGRADGSETS